MTEIVPDVTFLQFQKPGVHAGPVIQMTARLSVPESREPPAEMTRTLFVKGDRVSLSAGTVDSVYPPHNSHGDYSATLPHIVLSHPTLPWQRLLGVDDTSNAPWLALFLLSELDVGPDGKTPAWDVHDSTIGALKQPGDSTIFSTFALAPHEPGEADSDPCVALDIARPLFAAIAPRREDATYLAHVRELERGRKPTPQPESGDKLQYSVVIGNRLPPPEHSCRVVLVSLEHTDKHLPSRDGTLAIEERYTTIRLPVLHSWRFFAVEEKRTFGEVVSALDQNPSTLRLPPAATRTGPDADVVEQALAMGFVPAVHDLRLGGRTVSWYRGPFVPYQAERKQDVPLGWADSACRYDPTTGMMDTSAAAAWQLGRLLALNSASFAAQLYRWKRVNRRDTIDAAERSLLNLPPVPAGGEDAARRLSAEQALTHALGQALFVFGGIKGDGAARMGKGESVSGSGPGPGQLALILAAVPAAPPVRPPPALDRLQHLKQTMQSAAEIRKLHHHVRLTLRAGDGEDDTALPAEIRDWLGRLSLLQGVPLHYLVPSEAMLPAESMRFFQVDQSWITALIDGAFSLGRTTAASHAHDGAFAEDVSEGAAKAAAAQRQRIVGGAKALPRVASGFLMHSQAVQHWPGIEVEGFDADKGPANMLRLEKLTDTIMLCLFDRVVTTVNVHQPPEGVHFGFRQENGRYTKPLRRVQADGPNAVGSEMKVVLIVLAPGEVDDRVKGPSAGGDETSAEPFLRDADHHVLDVFGLAEWFKSKLQLKDASFTAAEFALEMVTGVDRVTFELPKTEHAL